MSDNKKGHLLFITPGFPQDEADTRCIPPLQDLARCLNEDFKYEITVIALHWPYRRRRYDWHGIDVNAVGIANSRVFRPLGWQRARKFMANLAEKKRPDFIHSFWWSEAAVLGNEFSKKYQIPHVCTVMGQDAKQADRFQKSISDPDFPLIGLSAFQEEVLKARTGRHFDRCIPWGLIPEHLPQIAEQTDIDILGVGSLIPLKRYHLLVELAERLVPYRPDLHVELIGTGPEEESLRQLVSEKGLTKNFRFPGFLSREQVLEKMGRSKILFHPGAYESFGMVLIEALAMGCQVVSSPVGIAPELQENTVLGNSVNDWADACSRILSSNLSRRRLLPYQLKDTAAAYARIYSK